MCQLNPEASTTSLARIIWADEELLFQLEEKFLDFVGLFGCCVYFEGQFRHGTHVQLGIELLLDAGEFLLEGFFDVVRFALREGTNEHTSVAEILGSVNLGNGDEHPWFHGEFAFHDLPQELAEELIHFGDTECRHRWWKTLYK